MFKRRFSCTSLVVAVILFASPIVFADPDSRTKKKSDLKACIDIHVPAERSSADATAGSILDKCKKEFRSLKDSLPPEITNAYMDLVHEYIVYHLSQED